MKKDNAHETAVVKPDVEILTVDRFVEAGFAVYETIKMGDPAVPGNVPVYAGQLIGPGAAVEVSALDGKTDENGEVKTSTLPTWMFYPLSPDTLSPIDKVIHTIICPHELDKACASAYATSQSKGKPVQMLIRWTGLSRLPSGRQINRYKFAMKIVE